MSENIVFKKKPLNPKLNRLFISWVELMAKDAKRTGNQCYFTYKKALSAIKKYPIKLKSGKDCLVLDGFGEKTCANLDKMLSEFAETKGLSLRRALRLGNKELCNNYKRPVHSFLPKKGSASHSIIMGLYELHLKSDADRCWNKKSEIMEAAKKHYHSSADTSNDDIKDSAWMSIKTLKSKELVEKNGKNYSLTESGKELYKTLQKVKEQKEISLQSVDNIVTNETSQVTDNSPDCLQLYYFKSLLSNDLAMVNLKSKAAFKIENDQKYFRVKIKEDDLKSHMDYIYDFDACLNDEVFIFVYLADKHAPVKGLHVKEVKSEIMKLSSTASSVALTAQPLVKSSIRNVPQPIIRNEPISIDSQRCVSPPLLSVGENNADSLYTMAKQSFDIVLIVDTRENYGTGKLKEYLCPKLASNGINYDIRPLPVGDFLWIAKDKLGREAVLDIIVERKRFDDLCASIIDNRFKDQKLRMKRLGISRILYLVEKCKNMKNLKIDLQTLYQNLINSEINDYCDVKITDNGAETVEYLSMLTRKLEKIYANKSIEIFSDFDCVTRVTSNPFDINVATFFGLDYTAFTQSSQKTKPLKVSEMFAKHLMCIHGITPEKANAIIDRYATPRLLVEAYGNCKTDKERESLFSDVKISANRKFGMASSKTVFCAYNKK